MILNLVALSVFMAVVVAAAVLLRRYLPRAAAAAADQPVCLGCGTHARQLPTDTFTCPVCRRDVRELGVALPRPAAYARPFWSVVSFTAVLCALALVVTAVLMQGLPQVEYVSADASLWSDQELYRRLEFSVGGRRIRLGSGRAPLEGELYADLFLTSGDVVTLEVLSPSLRCRVIDSAGREASPPGTLNETAVLRWMAAAELDAADRDVRAIARGAYRKIHEMLDLPLPMLAPVPEGGRGFMGSSGSSSGSAGPVTYATPAAVMIWSVLWLAGLWPIVRRGAGRRSSPARSDEGLTA